MKTVLSLLFLASLVTGCVTGSNEPHADSQGATKQDAGPALCRDGTVPPCNDR